MRRIVIGIVVLLVVLLVSAALLVRALLTPEILKGAVERQASDALGRTVTVGSVRAQLFPRTGIFLTQVVVNGPQHLTADEVLVGASLRGLLSKRVEGAVVSVRNGRLDFSDAATGVPSSAPARREPEVRRDGDAPGSGRTPTPADGAQNQDASGFTIDSVSEIVLDNVVVSGGGRQLRLDLQGALAGDRFDVASLTVSSGATSLQGTGSLTSISRRDGTFSLESPLIDVDEVLAVLGALLPANPSATGMSALSSEEPEGITFGHVTGRITVARGKALGYELTSLDGAIDLKGTTLTANPLAFDLYGGHYKSSLELNLATNHITLAHDATLAGASVGKLVELFGSAGAATGSLALTMQVRGAGRDLSSAARQVSGQATVRVADGTIAGLDVVRQAFTLLGTAPTENTQGERFESIAATLGVAGGTLSTDDFVLHSPDFDMKGRLRIGPDGRLAGHADLLLSDALSAQAQAKNRDLKLVFEGGRITLPATISGTLTKPRVLPDVSDALRRAARNKATEEVDKVKKKATDELKRGVDRLLKP